MTSEDAPLTEHQQRMMAYVDDEMTPEQRRSFEAELAKNPELAIEVAGYRNLIDLTDSMRAMEPADHEMRRFWAKFYNRGEWRLGWLLVAAGTAILFGFGVWSLCATDAPWIVKVAVLSVIAGLLLLLVNTIRFKMRTHQFDRYRGVLR